MKYKHTQKIKSIDISNKELANEIGDLYYDSLSNFLKELSIKLKSDANADYNRGRKKLAKSLYEASNYINLASKEIDTAWDICKPYVDEFLAKNGSNRE